VYLQECIFFIEINFDVTSGVEGLPLQVGEEVLLREEETGVAGYPLILGCINMDGIS
jgi:hypothetical protein